MNIVRRFPFNMPRVLGFTLLELLVTLAVVSILAVIAAPNLTHFLLNTRLTTTLNRFVGDLQLARSEAIKSNLNAVICPSTNARTCAEKGHWHEGWLIFLDTNYNRQKEADERVIQVVNDLDNGMTITGSRSSPIVYTNNGRSPGTNTTITFCDKRGAKAARQVIIANSGRVRSVSSGASPTLPSCPV